MDKTTYIALLRGINVSGNKIIKMEQLRKSVESLDLGDVRTYIQSGNIIFKGPKRSNMFFSQKLQKKILGDFGFSVPTLVKTADEIAATLKNNPFLKEKGIDTTKLHVSFLSEVPEKAALKALGAIAFKPDRFLHLGQEIYVHCPNGYGRTKLTNTVFEKILSVDATTRNWNTVNKIYEMSLE